MKRGLSYSKETHHGTYAPRDKNLIWHNSQNDEIRYFDNVTLAWELMGNGGGNNSNATRFNTVDLPCIQNQTVFNVQHTISHIVSISAAGKSLEVSEYSFNGTQITLNLDYILDINDVVSLTYSY